ncbi:MAG TPA: hypothetical protein VGF67_02630 [Ktedonobacteraceae bacterium]|jgi:hypothetical protein
MINKPHCGAQAEPTISGTTATATATVTTVIGAAGTIYSVVNTLNGTIGTAGTSVIYGAAIIAAVVTWTVIFVFYYERCLDTPRGFDGCSSGVIEQIVLAFSSTVEQVFPFAGMHDRVDVVVKSTYWPLVSANARFVRCAGFDGSPILSGFYHNDQVCAAGLGAAIGGAAGAVAGIIIAAAAALAIGCATWILCILALIVAIVLAIVATVIGATAGGAIGKAAASSGTPGSSGGGLIPATPLSVGDYVTTRGNLIISGDLEGAIVYWFVQNTTLHGRSTGSPHFDHMDPDKNLIIDACPNTDPPIQ